MIFKRFREAAKGHGKYCPVKNELLVRKGRQFYRFTCGESELRFTAPGCEEVVLPFAPDVEVREFRRSIAGLMDPR